MTLPKISVVIPTYNQAMYLRGAIDSVLNQTFKDFELIIINDGSTDTTEDIILTYKDPRIIYIRRTTNKGIGEALNLGFSLAKGKYESWNSSDNEYYPTALEEMYTFLEANPSVDYVYTNGDYIYTDPDGITIKTKKNINEVYGVKQPWQPRKLLLEGGYNLGIIFLWRRKLRDLVKEGFYSGICEDLEFTCRAVLSGAIYTYLPKCLGFYRYHPKVNYNKLSQVQINQLILDTKEKTEKFLEIEDKTEEFFTKIYIYNDWNGYLGRSGKASEEQEIIVPLQKKLIELINKYNIKSILDIGCGDFLWIREVINQTGIYYTGIDIVKPLIRRNQERFSKENIQFKHSNFLKTVSNISTDLVLVRNTVNYYPISDIKEFLSRLTSTKSKYLLITSADKTDKINPILDKKAKSINLTQPPFSLVKPKDIIPDYQSNLLLYKLKNNWYLDKIPKKIYFYWGNNILPYLQYMTLYSFWKYNPDWDIVLFTPKFLTDSSSWDSYHHKYLLDTSQNYWGRLLKEIPLTIQEFDMKTIGKSNNLPEVHKSDIIRAYLMSEFGGIWSDMDILFFKPIQEIYLNNKNFSQLDCTVSSYPKDNTTTWESTAIGFQISAKHNKIYKYIYSIVKNIPDTDKYEGYGFNQLSQYLQPNQLAKKFPDIKYENLKKDVVYSYFFERQADIFTTNRDYFTKDSIGLHWFAGNSIVIDWINKINENTYTKYDNVICNLLKRILG